MEIPWSFDVDYTHVQNLEQKRRPYCMNDAGSMEVPWRFDVDYMDFPGMF